MSVDRPFASLAELDERLENLVQDFKRIVRAHQEEYPSFIGARLVFVAIKKRDTGGEDSDTPALAEALERLVPLKRRHPEWIAGVDLVGEEDVSEPLSNYAEALLRVRRKAEAEGVDLPFLVHAGESYLPSNHALVDAFLLGAERVGHGLMLPRHPALMAQAAAAGVPAVEVCPISNQVLGYVPNLMDHPGLVMMRNGVKITLK